jgi:SPP1 family predicted phage head-tail adaptor
MIIGALNDRITIQASTESRSPSGETTLQWTTVATVWAQVDGLSARDLVQAQQANVLATHKIRIRYRAGISHLQRVIWKGRTMEIASASDRRKQEYIEMLVREVQ